MSLEDDAIRFDGCDEAVIGTDQRGYLVYDYSKLVEILIAQEMTEDEVVEWIGYNVVGILPYNYTILYKNKIDDIL